MNLELIDGPLDTPLLESIAGLYGRFNDRYANVDFTRRLFNENPGGAALHAFVFEDGLAVGHYAILPMAIAVDGTRRRSGKGEAFVVHPDYRNGVVAVAGRPPILPALALPLHLYRHALDRGLDPIHMIAERDVGAIHRMVGCRPLDKMYRQARFVLDAHALAAGVKTVSGRAMAAALPAAQRVAFEAARAFAFGAEVRVWSGAELARERLERIAAHVPSVRGWTLAIDAPTLSWLADIGELRVFAVDEAMEDYVVSLWPRSGSVRTVEVLLLRRSGRHARAVEGLLAAVVTNARRAGAAFVYASELAAWTDDDARALRSAARHLAFLERHRSASMLVRSDDVYFHDPDHLRFSPLFHAAY
jgi:hypothetical protein